MLNNSFCQFTVTVKYYISFFRFIRQNPIYNMSVSKYGTNVIFEIATINTLRYNSGSKNINCGI